MDNKIVGCLDDAAVEKIIEAYNSDSKNTIVRHALSRTAISDTLFNSASVAGVTLDFSTEVKTMKVANQKASGRCWIFAGLNLLREIVAKKINVGDFELTQNYISLYDKIEKSNYALESVIQLVDKDSEDRVLQFILNCPVSDGGQWDMFVNLVKKYGLMPKNAFPETFQSNNTRESDFLVNAAIRNFAYDARKLHLEGKDNEIRPLKDKVMANIYKMFLNCFGVPPKSFTFEYTDKDGKYHAEEGMTPMSFFEKYIGSEVDEYQSLINSPTNDKPYGRNFTVDFLGNVVEGKPINHLNVTMDRMKELIIAQLKSDLPVWFGSDVGFYRDRTSWAWDGNAFDYVSSFGFDCKFDKAGMLDYRHSAMNHAMLITGVNEANGVANRWKIENSWGGDNGSCGYYVMTPSFFDTFVYQAVVNKKFLSKEELEATKAEPIHLNPWDPMGTLAD